MNSVKAVALVLGLNACGLGIVRSLEHDQSIKIIGIGDKNSSGIKTRYLKECYIYDTKNRDDNDIAPGNVNRLVLLGKIENKIKRSIYSRKKI